MATHEIETSELLYLLTSTMELELVESWLCEEECLRQKSLDGIRETVDVLVEEHKQANSFNDASLTERLLKEVFNK